MNVNRGSNGARIGPSVRGIARAAAGGLGFAALGYAAATAASWARYGHAGCGREDDQDSMLDRFMPTYDVVERHHVTVGAPPAVTLAAASEQELMSNRAIRAIFKARELVMGSTPQPGSTTQALLPLVLSMGWRVLAETKDREIVVGAVTRPWEPNVSFHGVDADAFAAFADPGYVKIIWSLRADPLGADRAVFRTETRAIATDRNARVKFRRYWAFASPGIWLIRRALLGPLKREAERRAMAS